MEFLLAFSRIPHHAEHLSAKKSWTQETQDKISSQNAGIKQLSAEKGVDFLGCHSVRDRVAQSLIFKFRAEI